ncbi:MAG: hypothetical protein HNEKOMLI_00846 [Sodalis sp. Psp]|nr:hypothetical protein [Sodalis sp. Psp]MCR3757177.1 hypothetical protein [Sodalis sp. Ppy]
MKVKICHPAVVCDSAPVKIAKIFKTLPQLPLAYQVLSSDTLSSCHIAQSRPKKTAEKVVVHLFPLDLTYINMPLQTGLMP